MWVKLKWPLVTRKRYDADTFALEAKAELASRQRDRAKDKYDLKLLDAIDALPETLGDLSKFVEVGISADIDSGFLRDTVRIHARVDVARSLIVMAASRDAGLEIIAADIAKSIRCGFTEKKTITIPSALAEVLREGGCDVG